MIETRYHRRKSVRVSDNNFTLRKTMSVVFKHTHILYVLVNEMNTLCDF